jgi:hypothetical protein
LNTLSIKWLNGIGYIQVFYSSKPSKKFKQEIFRYYKKTKKAMKILESCSVPKYLILENLTDKRLYIQKLSSKNIFLKLSLISLLTKQNLLQKIIKIFKINHNFS